MRFAGSCEPKEKDSGLGVRLIKEARHEAFGEALRDGERLGLILFGRVELKVREGFCGRLPKPREAAGQRDVKFAEARTEFVRL